MTNSGNFSFGSLENNQKYLNIPSLKLLQKSKINGAISQRSYGKESQKFQNIFDKKSLNFALKGSSKQERAIKSGQPLQDENRTQVSNNQKSENLNEQNFLIPTKIQLREKRSKSTTVSQRVLGKAKQHRYSEDINPSFPTFPSLKIQVYQSQIQHRRSLIQKTKKQVEEFNEKNFKLLNDIKQFRQQMSKRNSYSHRVDKKPIDFLEKSKRKYSLIDPQFSQEKKNSQLQKISQTEKNQFHQISDYDFMIIRKLGSGTFANVYLAIEKHTGFLVTLKKISRNILKTEKCLQQIINEIKLQMYLNHPNILKIYGFYIDQESVTLILEFMEDGNLYEKLMRKGSLKQDETSQIMAEILFALEQLHQKNIVHRDLKPQNILLSHGVRKLCDFGTANICQSRRSTVCGTLDYSAPQLIEGKQYNISLDLWSIGVMTFELLTSKTPFFHARRKDTIKEIAQYQDGQVKFPQNISAIAQQFIASFLVKDPQYRVKIKEALNAQFILSFLDEETNQLRQKHDFFQQKNR